MGKLIDADELTEMLKQRLHDIEGYYGEISPTAGAVSGAIKLIQAQSEAVVRCKDCRWYKDKRANCWLNRTDDDYCSEGERRTDGTD